MAKVHGTETYVSLDGNNLTTFCDSMDFNVEADEHDVTCYGDDDHVYEGGLGNGEVTIGGKYDSSATGPRDVILPLRGTKVTLIRRPEGTGSGLPQDSVTVLVRRYVETSPVADMVTWTCELRLSGPVTTTNQA